MPSTTQSAAGNGTVPSTFASGGSEIDSDGTPTGVTRAIQMNDDIAWNEVRARQTLDAAVSSHQRLGHHERAQSGQRGARAPFSAETDGRVQQQCDEDRRGFEAFTERERDAG